MPPPIPEHQKRFTANPTRPARYRPGKAVEEEDSDEGFETEEEEVAHPKPKPVQKKSTSKAAPAIQPEESDEDEEGFVTEEEDDHVQVQQTKPIRTTNSAAHTPAEQHAQSLDNEQEVQPQSSSEDAESGSEDDSDEESESSEDEPQRKFVRPTFIKKTDRNASSRPDSTTPAPDLSSSHHDDEVAARRLEQAESMIKTTIERDTAARLAGKKAWDDDDDLPAEMLVDDTDGVDVEAEHAAWRLRELTRLKRDREAMVAREKELEEIERRRNLTAEEREKEDREVIDKQKEEKESRAKAGYLGRYHHKGAFFMDEETSARLASRDLVGAKFADDVDKSALPEYMKIRDMTKLGKKGRTRYTDLKGQDTGRFGDQVKRWRGSGYDNDRDGRDDLRGVDERFLPDRDGGPQVSGTNTMPVGEGRRRRSGSRDGERAQGEMDRYRPRSRSRSRSPARRRRRDHSPRLRSRSRSISPQYRSRRRRTSSPYRSPERDKRRRVEA